MSSFKKNNQIESVSRLCAQSGFHVSMKQPIIDLQKKILRKYSTCKRWMVRFRAAFANRLCCFDCVAAIASLQLLNSSIVRSLVALIVITTGDSTTIVRREISANLSIKRRRADSFDRVSSDALAERD